MIPMKIHYISVWICVMGWMWKVVPVNSNSIGKAKMNNFQYVNAPAQDQYEFAFNRGGTEHQISRHQLFKDGNFQAKVKWSDAYEGVGGSYFDYNHGRDGGSQSSNIYDLIQYQQQIPALYEPIKDDTTNSEFQPDYADFDEKNDDVIEMEPMADSVIDKSSDSKSSSVVAAALIQTMPQRNIENLFRLPTLSVAQHLIDVYSLMQHQ